MKIVHIGERRPHPSFKGEYDICSIRSGDLVKPLNWTKFIEYSAYEKLKTENKKLKERVTELKLIRDNLSLSSVVALHQKGLKV